MRHLAAPLACCAAALALTSCAPGDGGTAAPPPVSATPRTPTATPTPTPTTTPARAGDGCGVVTIDGGDRFRLTVARGEVRCAEARAVFATYLGKLRGGEGPGNGGGGAITVSGGVCQSGTAVDPGSSCRKDGSGFTAKALEAAP